MATEMRVERVDDFEVTGDGNADAWARSGWHTMARVGGASSYASRCKVLYSGTGVYFLVECEDRKLTCTMTQDFDDIYREDVVEVFLWPHEAQDLYFEYEISPLNVELPILVPNHRGGFMGWRPWHYEGNRRTRRATSVQGGAKAPGALVQAWTSEFFLPFALFAGLGNTPAMPGTKWRGNMYRIDYDDGKPSQWAWCERAGTNFHSFRDFGTLIFC